MANPLDVAASAMSAQMLRLNTTASNLANADSLSSSEAEAYRAKQPVFSAVMDQQQAMTAVAVSGVVESDAPIPKRYEPGNPMADEQGYVYGSNVNTVEEMANMISASRAYQNNADVFSTTKTLMLRTLQLGQN
ncbi:flagellar basal-body rod protein FlgC [Spongiibacter sp. IMCC21906]|jgi:flagellar basal-body rod protein FlgC|uniref:flagellar basal body rod protein FlgC n=1 Tax=Spongiibacter sp. IMCC21906 TaxID=1620392 RepID=UPI00062DDB5F|nr:flagellar basal body rod protein FlgC [Spongiibacter sp. IMCC21906]AKH69422.1 flagellar basal-body rod protein FlgC [Spongiibacter sp. IMCC21906]